MAKGVIETWDKLEDFTRRSVKFDGVKRDVYVAGQGPGVIVIHEVPGITPEVARFARMVREAGFTVYMPSLLGKPGKPNSQGYIDSQLFRVLCIAREFNVWAADDHSPIVDWLKQLAAAAHKECGGKGVGALGMCLTGNFAMSMMVEPAVLAPVLCQPSLPARNPGGIHASPEDVAVVRARLEAEDLTIKGYRFDGDPHCKAARFAAFKEAFGDRFEGEVLPDSAAKPDTFRKHPHSVVTSHLVNEAGSLTRQKVDEIIAFFKLRL
ncbi:MAG: dienelactone hydrolase family protein [Terricaulis sp.]